MVGKNKNCTVVISSCNLFLLDEKDSIDPETKKQGGRDVLDKSNVRSVDTLKYIGVADSESGQLNHVLFYFDDGKSWLLDVPIDVHLRIFLVHTVCSCRDRIPDPDAEMQDRGGRNEEVKIYKADKFDQLKNFSSGAAPTGRNEELEKQTQRDVRRIAIDDLPAGHDIKELTEVEPSSKNKLKNTKLIDFELESVLGRGAFGKVFLASLKDNKGVLKKHAIKAIRLDVIDSGKVFKEIMLEKEIMFSIDHPFLLNL